MVAFYSSGGEALQPIPEDVNPERPSEMGKLFIVSYPS